MVELPSSVLVVDARPSVPKTPSAVAIDGFFKQNVDPQFMGQATNRVLNGSLSLLEALGYISAYSDYSREVHRTLTQEYGDNVPTNQQLQARLQAPELVSGFETFIQTRIGELNASLGLTQDPEKQALLTKETETYKRAAAAYPKVH